MTMLEKAARAMVDACDPYGEKSALDPVWHRGNPDDVRSVYIDGPLDFTILARAALLAIREPSEAILAASPLEDQWGDADTFSSHGVWESMIDAILNEGEEVRE